jgi:hypothetical protein
VALFALQFYESLPRLAVFVQDDASARHQARLVPLLRAADADDVSATAAAHGLAAWVDAAERRPFGEHDTCLCNPIIEDFWHACPPESPFPPGTPRCYGDFYWPMRWFMETFLDFPTAGDDWGAVRWPGSAQMAVPAWAIRSRPKALYALMLQMINATYAPVGEEAVAGQAQYTVLYRAAQLHWRPWGAHEWAHIFERMWFAVFDTRYTPQGPPGPPVRLEDVGGGAPRG